MRNPKVFLLDEPLSNLDAVLRVQMRTELKLIFNRLRATVAYVTHDQAEAMTMSDRVAVFRGGVLQQVDTPLTIYHAPANQFVAGFVGSPPMNFITAKVGADGVLCIATDSQSLGRLPDVDLRPYAGKSVTVGIRPEDVRLTAESSPGGVSGTVEVVEQLGSSTLAYVRLGVTLVAVQLAGSTVITPGQTQRLNLPTERLYVFQDDADGIAIRTPGLP